LVEGNDNQANRLYLNNGTADPWAGVTGSDITADADNTHSIALGDVDGDGDLDLVVGNDYEANRLYVNNGTAAPWSSVTGSDITADAGSTYSVVLGDVDGDGDLDLMAGNYDQTNRLHLNDGTGNFGAGSDIDTDGYNTRSVVLGDVDGDGDLDLVAGNGSQANRLYLGVPFYDTGRGRATSLEVDTVSGPITNATLTAVAMLPANTWINFWLSNDGGAHWQLVQPGTPHWFVSLGSDLRWRAELHSLSPALTPRIEQILITSEDPGDPIVIGDRVWEDLDGDGIQDTGEPGMVSVTVYLYDDQGIVDFTFTDTSGYYSFPDVVWHDQDYQVRFVPVPGYTFSPRDQGSDDEADSDADPATGYTEVFNLFSTTDDNRWDAGMVPFVQCSQPDELLYIYDMGTTIPEGYPVLHWYDWNQPEQVTGYNVYRTTNPALPHDQWDLVASDIVDGDEGTPNNQWIDQGGASGGPYFYQVAAYNHHCPVETAEGPW
jgi:hypothetical protein